MNNAIHERIFLVGCPRSGTTLLQSLLAANSHIASFPESHFFENLFSSRSVFAVLGIASRRAGPHWKIFLEELGHPEMRSALPRMSLFVRQFSSAFVRVLDTLTLDGGRTNWVEKSPGHLRFVDQIEKLIDGAKFVHILRNGLDNIASLYEVGNKYPETWGLWCGTTLDQCIQRWVVDTRLSMKCASKENHRLVRYEQIVADPRSSLVDLCEFVGVPFEEQMLTDYTSAAAQVILKREPWKLGTCEPIQVNRRSKFHSLLDERQRRYVRACLPEDL